MLKNFLKWASISQDVYPATNALQFGRFRGSWWCRYMMTQEKLCTRHTDKPDILELSVYHNDII